MDLGFQQNILASLKVLAEKDSHSILISGIRGAGKTYVAKKFSSFKDIPVFHPIQPKVGDLKDLIDSSYSVSEPQVICIENLDAGTSAAAQVILKYLEEPLPYVYIVVTCINTAMVPSTILSRSIQLQLEPPKDSDLQNFAELTNSRKYELVKSSPVFQCCKSLCDVKDVLDMSFDQINYYTNFKDDSTIWNQTSDQIIWMLSHFENNDKTDLRYVFRIIYRYITDDKYKKLALEALLALEQRRISESAILGNFVLGVKY